METYIQNHPWTFTLIVCLVVIDYSLKVYSLWFAARNRQTAWFICLAVFNTVGILPLIYLSRFKERKPAA
jgi:predicted permease